MSKIILALATLGMLACVKLPETGKSTLMFTTPKQEAQMGEQGYKEVLSKSKINQDPRLNAMLRRVGRRIAAVADQKDFKWEFTLIESKEVNAWCMPGGKVAFYTAILPYLQNEAGMAAVMGHEVAHAVMRHSGQRIARQMKVNAVLALLSVGLSNSEHKPEAMAAMGVGGTFFGILPFSREHESEADVIGLKYMAKAGYDPEEAVRFWQRFKSAGGSPPEFMSTHPAGDHRIRDLNANMPQAKKFYSVVSTRYGAGEKI